jgi:hypothetical protein
MKGSPVVFLLLALASCEFVSEVDVPEIPPRLVVNSFFYTDSAWTVYLSQHRHILQENFPSAPQNAIVTITAQSGASFTLEGGAVDEGVQLFQHPSAPVLSESYTIRVSAPGFDDAEATATTPGSVDLISVWLDSANIVPHNYNGPGSIPVEFTFQDPPGRGDYYIPRFFVWGTRAVRRDNGQVEFEDGWEPGWLSKSPDNGGFAEFDSEHPGLTDEGLDGDIRTVRLHAHKSWWSSNEPKDLEWKFTLTHVKEEYYRYVHSVRLQRNNEGNPLAQPVQIFSNVKGGLGIFAGSATSSFEHRN